MNRKKKVQIESEIGEKFIAVLVSDVIATLDRQAASPSQQNNRDVIRTTFAAIEGLVWFYRDHVIEIARDMGRLTFEQEAALAEVGYQVTATGKIAKQARYVPLSPMFRLVTRIAAALDPALRVRFDTYDWERFQASIGIRNRVTHPKTKTDLIVSQADVESSLQSFYWLCDVVVHAMEGANLAFASHVNRLRRFVELLKARDPDAVQLYYSAGKTFDE